MKKLKVPQLWLMGEDDKVAENSRNYFLFNEMRKVKHKKLMMVPEAGHFMMSKHSEMAQKEFFNFSQRLI